MVHGGALHAIVGVEKGGRREARKPKCCSGTLKAPVGPRWHGTVKPKRLEQSVRPLSGSRSSTARQNSKKVIEIKTVHFGSLALQIPLVSIGFP